MQLTAWVRYKTSKSVDVDYQLLIWAFFCHEARKHFILNFRVDCSLWGRYFQILFFFYMQIVNVLRQVSLTISEFTHSIMQPCRRCDIKFIWQFTNFVKLILKNMIKKNRLSMQAVEFKPWNNSKEFLSIFYFSLPDEGSENKTY